MAKFRIVQKGPDNYAVQEKGWFFWRHASYTCTIAGDLRLHFLTESDARDWITETLKLRAEMAEVKAFKPRVVWESDLERENADLRHDLERAMANHSADLNKPQQ